MSGAGDGRAHAGRWLPVALALALIAGACSESPPEPGAAATPTPPPTPTPSPEPRPEVLVTRAFDGFTAAIRRTDTRSAIRFVDDDSVEYLTALERATSSAGPGAIERLSTYEKLVVTTLRTARGSEWVEGLSPPAFLGYLIGYKLVRIPKWLSIAPAGVEVSGRHAVVHLARHGGRRLSVTFELRDGSWKVDVRKLLEVFGWQVDRISEKRGEDKTAVIYAVSSVLSGKLVDPETVWDKR